MNPSKQASRVVEAVHKQVKASADGVRGAAAGIGKSRGYFDDRRRAGTIDILQLFEVLRNLGSTPQEFFSSVFAPEERGLMERIERDVRRAPSRLEAETRRLMLPDEDEG